MAAFMSARQAAKVCGVSEKTVRRWIAAGRIRADRQGRDFRIPPSEVAAMAAPSAAVGAAPDSGHDAACGPQATTPHHDAAEWAALVRELKTELVQTAAAASMWQARAEMLGHRLRALEAPRAAPTDAPESRQDARETASAAGVVPESTPAPSGPWWRRALAALLGAPG